MFCAVMSAIIQLNREAWKNQDFNMVQTRDLAIPVRRFNQLSYEASDVGSWCVLDLGFLWPFCVQKGYPNL